MTQYVEALFSTDEAGEEIIYTPESTGVPQTIVGIVSRGGDSYQRTTTDKAKVRVLVSDVPDPKHGDTLTINDDEYSLTDESKITGGKVTWILPVTKDNQATYRGRR